MKFNFFFGNRPKLTQKDATDFSHKGYECRLLFQTQKGEPVGVYHDNRNDIWKVQYGYSQVFFGTYAEAMAFCRGRFTDLDGKQV